MKNFFIFTILTAFLGNVNAECANACSGHGKCTSYDMCICNRNWQSNDCSERICQFGLAHVDTPKGDLDMSGALTGPDHPVIENHFTYPYGTTEQFPQMQDSDLNNLLNSAHYYMECSNKGTCDRTSGECACYDGYDGVSCQRASCPGYPNSCSGHGVCKTIRQLAAGDHGNVYELWDKDATMGCDCDAGYNGPDCSLRQCKTGIDPLYLDDVSTIKYSIFDVAVLTDSTTTVDTTTSGSLFSNGESEPKTGYWALRFYDSFGEDWLTTALPAGASCVQLVAALEALPNRVVPAGQTYCTLTSKIAGGFKEGAWAGTDAQHNGRDHYHMSPQGRQYSINYNMSIWDADGSSVAFYSPLTPHSSSYVKGQGALLSGYIYRLKFYGNPGALREPEIEIYLDGKRPSLVAQTASKKVITKVWTDGQQGEDNDYFADHCDGVTVTIGISTNGASAAAQVAHHFLSGFTTSEKNLLKACLGSSDFDTSNNKDVYNWDYGSIYYPHMVKLVRTVTTYSDGGYYAVLWYDKTIMYDNLGALTDGTFRLLNPINPPDAFYSDNYEIYTTKGVLALTSNKSEATFGFGSKTIYMGNASYDEVDALPFDGDISCEIGNNNAYKTKYLFHCMDKGDIFTLLNWEYPLLNPPHLNLYTAQRLMHSDLLWSNNMRFPRAGRKINSLNMGMHFMTHTITTDLSTNWAAATGVNPADGTTIDANMAWFRVYKFFPDTTSTYNYVAPCANRGICDTSSATCKCFPGYTSDSCSEQSSIAI